jgi:LuxR family maltose regulon positive regulatory protein
MTTTAYTALPLVRTKLAPPRSGNAPVSRDGLLRQLDELRERKVTLVLGPAGCGKTSLLTQWRKNLLLQGGNVAWYNACEDDDDPHIASYIVEALQQSGVTIDAEALHVYVRSGGKVSKALLTTLVNDLSDHEGEVYLVIDDFHHISTFGALQLIDRWIRLLPPGLHLVLSSRLRPPLDLSSMRAENQLTELSFIDLRFDLEETRRFVYAQGLTSLTPEHIHALHEITDGWVAGLQLLSFSLRKRKAPDALLERGKLSLYQATALNEYLGKATLEHLTSDEIEFLIRISACRRFNWELCEHLTANPRAAEYLAKLERENLFLLPIDTTDVEPWYRFHRLFASFLEERLQQFAAPDFKRLHQLASNWFASKNLLVEAMRHAILAEDSQLMLDLIDRAAHPMINGANFVEFLKWCDAVPSEDLATRVNVCLSAAWAQLSCSRVTDFERTMADILHHAEHAKPAVAVEVQLLQAYRLVRQDNTASSLKIVESLMRQGATANKFQSLLMYNIAGLALIYANDFERARDVTHPWLRYEIPKRHAYPKPLIEVVGGFSHLMEGNIRLAMPALAAFIDDALRTTDFGADAAGMYAGYLLDAYYHAGELQLARAFLDHYTDLIDAVGVADGVLFAYRVRARIEQLDGDEAAARLTLGRLEEFGYRQSLDRLVAWSLYEQVGLALKSGDSAPLQELLRRLDRFNDLYRDHRSCAWSEIPLAASLAKADVAFAQAANESVMEAIDAAGVAARANRRQLLVTRLSLMKAIVLLRDSQGKRAITVARDCIRVALDFGMMRVLADLGRHAVPLIESLLETRPSDGEREYLESSLQCIKNPKGSSAQPSNADAAQTQGTEPSSSEVLTPRELEVLALLSKALSVKGVARVLGLSPGTVKWHVKNIYAKLGAVSREETLAKARGLRLIR